MPVLGLDPADASAWAAVVQALAAVVVGTYVVVQVLGESKARARATAAADARVSGLAFRIRREIAQWVASHPDQDSHHVEGWLRTAQNARTFDALLVTAEDRMTEVVSVSGDAAPSVAENVRQAYIHLLSATDRLRRYAAIPHPDGVELWDWLHLRASGVTDLREAIRHLDRLPLQRALAETDRALQAQRDSEEPFHQLANALVSAHRRSDGSAS